MRWENLSAPQFEKAVKETGVCILALGVLEKHGDHLPLGTDMILAHELACEAVKHEPAVVFPPFYFGQIFEARAFPGTIAIKPSLLLELFQDVLDEIGRNGFKKIIITNQHGGNEAFLKFLGMCQLSKKRDYNVYFYTQNAPERTHLIKSLMESEIQGHACECETSRMLYYHEDLVDLTQTNGLIKPLDRLNHISDLFTGLWWYAKVPNHIIGDPNKATKEKGKAIEELEAKLLAKFIKSVKEDQILQKLSFEFHQNTNF